ncbi:efflux RND transporter periplasmic adaptor subunit [Novosphingobium sp. KACC 22771]|uniref:efflux RND transporter periplasmic adaptor subunit n=1 Tax=Novosphingobium sp. KACC 22771 TaxID=3025670 RepID=UPI002365ABC8|nr:efflux RND transporter periplasmic adaptor subunit [Novosphingobium sp. KACC 22771]WDF73634.1 efflux RND transporter periplasmic adaptor subunit [Novosphingobium sp. KACC 22771]
MTMHKGMKGRGGILLLGLALSLQGCGQDKPASEATVAAKGPRLTVTASDTPDWQSVSAEVTSQDQAQVLARIPGILTSLSVRAGDMVRKGQVLGRIADNQLAYQSAAYGAQAAAAQAQAAQAKAELDRVKFLAANGVYAKARLEQAEAGAQAAVAQTQAARAQQAGIRAIAGNGAVIAPATGRVLRADVPAGSPVAPGMVVAVVTSGPVVLRLDLPEALAAKVRPGARVRVEGLSHEGSVTRIYPAVTAGQVSADVAVAGLDAGLIGRRLSAQLAAGTHRGIIVPRAFVVTRYGLDYVQVAGKTGGVMQVPVQTAPAADGKSVEILSGVNAGDVLVGAV